MDTNVPKSTTQQVRREDSIWPELNGKRSVSKDSPELYAHKLLTGTESGTVETTQPGDQRTQPGDQHTQPGLDSNTQPCHVAYDHPPRSPDRSPDRLRRSSSGSFECDSSDSEYDNVLLFTFWKTPGKNDEQHGAENQSTNVTHTVSKQDRHSTQDTSICVTDSVPQQETSLSVTDNAPKEDTPISSTGTLRSKNPPISKTELMPRTALVLPHFHSNISAMTTAVDIHGNPCITNNVSNSVMGVRRSRWDIKQNWYETSTGSTCTTATVQSSAVTDSEATAQQSAQVAKETSTVQGEGKDAGEGSGQALSHPVMEGSDLAGGPDSKLKSKGADGACSPSVNSDKWAKCLEALKCYIDDLDDISSKSHGKKHGDPKPVSSESGPGQHRSNRKSESRSVLSSQRENDSRPSQSNSHREHTSRSAPRGHRESESSSSPSDHRESESMSATKGATHHACTKSTELGVSEHSVDVKVPGCRDKRGVDRVRPQGDADSSSSSSSSSSSDTSSDSDSNSDSDSSSSSSDSVVGRGVEPEPPGMTSVSLPVVGGKEEPTQQEVCQQGISASKETGGLAGQAVAVVSQPPNSAGKPACKVTPVLSSSLFTGTEATDSTATQPTQEAVKYSHSQTKDNPAAGKDRRSMERSGRSRKSRSPDREGRSCRSRSRGRRDQESGDRNRDRHNRRDRSHSRDRHRHDRRHCQDKGKDRYSRDRHDCSGSRDHYHSRYSGRDSTRSKEANRGEDRNSDRHRRSGSTDRHRRSRSTDRHRRSRSTDRHRRSRSTDRHRRSRSTDRHRRSRSTDRHRRSGSRDQHRGNYSRDRPDGDNRHGHPSEERGEHCRDDSGRYSHGNPSSNKQNSPDERIPAGYCFVEFHDADMAHRAMLRLNGKVVPGSVPPKRFKLNHASYGNEHLLIPEYSLFVGDLSDDVDDLVLYTAFAKRYSSCRAAKVVLDQDGKTRGYGFVRFTEETDQQRALIEMQHFVGVGRKLIRVSLATPKKPMPPAVPGSGPPQQYTHGYYQQYQQYAGYYNAWAGYQYPAQYYQQYSQPYAGTGYTDPQAQAQQQAQVQGVYEQTEYEVEELEDPSAEIDILKANQQFMEESEELYLALEGSRWHPLDTITSPITAAVSS